MFLSIYSKKWQKNQIVLQHFSLKHIIFGNITLSKVTEVGLFIDEMCATCNAELQTALLTKFSVFILPSVLFLHSLNTTSNTASQKSEHNKVFENAKFWKQTYYFTMKISIGPIF